MVRMKWIRKVDWFNVWEMILMWGIMPVIFILALIGFVAVLYLLN